MEFEVSIFDSTTHCEREYVHEEETDKKFDLEGTGDVIYNCKRSRAKVMDVSLYSCGNAHTGRGWREFCVANCLKEERFMMFDIVKQWKEAYVDVSLILLCNRRTKSQHLSSREAVPNVEVITEMPHFSCTMKLMSSRSVFWQQVPNPFARLNGLSNRKCTIMIRDREQRSWKFSLYSCGRHTCIGGGWNCVANCLKEGDQA
ncbi:hypothetical protein HAX54_005995 [Datura stramonium]|uniref:TF-B3 domain-containing protein n=1 Tax=Datura stramonium TaxID=4076 RepID=A0ABS8RHS7_DATST|nr:hypothetical protein [Datura stramonium]